MERFACRTVVVSGQDALEALGEASPGRMLVVTEPEWIRYGLTERIRQAAKQPEMAVFESYDAIPTMARAVEGSRKIKEFRPGLVVALGGEGTLDLGKAMTCFSKHPCTLAVIPTAFGTGTEVNDRALLSHNGRCHLLRHESLRPALAVLDGTMTEKTEKMTVAEGGFSLLAAAVESYSALPGGLLTGLHAREAFGACWASLPAAVSGSPQARARLQKASVLAGLAVEGTGRGLCGAMENSLSAVFGLSRGKAAAILLPAVIGCNGHASGRRYTELSRTAGMGGSREEIGIRNLRTGLIRLRRELELPGSLTRAGIDLRQVWNSSRRIVELTLEDPNCRNNPVTVDDFLVRRILEEITGRI